MIAGVNGTVGRTAAGNDVAPLTRPSGSSFAKILRESIEEVSKLQETGNQAIQDLATGKTQNIEQAISKAEMGDMAFKTLLAIRAKLLDAYNEIKNIGV